MCLFNADMSFQKKCCSPRRGISTDVPAILLLGVVVMLGLPSQGQIPTIVQQPASQTIFYGDPVTFQATASGAAR